MGSSPLRTVTRESNDVPESVGDYGAGVDEGEDFEVYSEGGFEEGCNDERSFEKRCLAVVGFKETTFPLTVDIEPTSEVNEI